MKATAYYRKIKLGLARPLPGPLPQERLNHLPRSGDSEFIGCRLRSKMNVSAAATATTANEFSRGADTFSLSPGERAGVRASIAVPVEPN